MKWLIIPLLWVLAIGAALLILYRLWRGQNVVMTGRWSPRFIRMVAVVLVLLGAAQEKSAAAPLPMKDKPATGQSEEQLPPVVTAERVHLWLRGQNQGGWLLFKQAFVQFTLTPRDPTAKANAEQYVGALTVRLANLVKADLAALAVGKECPSVELRDLPLALDEMEQAGIFDHWANAYLWRKTPTNVGEKERSQLVEWYARLHRHARLTDTLIRARAQVKPFLMPPRAWMSKAGPRPEHLLKEKVGAGDVLAAARKLYPLTGAGTWDRDGCVVLTVAKESAAVVQIRAGQREKPGPLAAIRLTRLDLLETPAGDTPVVLEHAWAGRITLPPGRLLSVWDLPGCLSAEARKKVAVKVDAALGGDETAARRLEDNLPLVQGILRQKLVVVPAGKEVAKLRLILSLFDDAVTAVPPAETGPGVEDVPRARGAVMSPDP
jgi:hypothetical protein